MTEEIQPSFPLPPKPVGYPEPRRGWIRRAISTLLMGTVAAVPASRRAEGQTLSSASNPRELQLPPDAKNPLAVEVLRVWAVPGQAQQLVLKTTWRDPGAWGLLLVDVARHAANAYGEEGGNKGEAFNRIVELFKAEIAQSTDTPKKL